MVQIKVTPEMLEEVANRASNTRIALESIHNNLCNEIDHLCFQWIGASNQQFIQMFNDARPKAFTSISSLVQVEEDLKRIAEKFRNADDQDVTMEEGAMCGKTSSEEKGFDGGKLARDIAGEISGEYDVRRVWDGIDPSTGEKLSGWERAGAGVMAVAGLTPFGKIAKVGKGVKMTAKATEAVNTAKKVPVGGADVVKGTGKALLTNEGKVGTYKQLVKQGTAFDNITPHHMPSAEKMKQAGIKRNDGVSMNMEQPHPGTGGRHRETYTYGLSGEKSKAYLNLSFRDALAHDILDARRIYIKDGLHTAEIREGLREVIKRNKELYPHLFDK
ncbi:MULTISPECIES: WXG100 family type VII secretion target [Bacillus cereus group]|uniref:WXG100 family type VII secretion target n=1 Tax=Bacillus cereus group TaxID=86661 RepID=UPI000775AC9A|nr:MULTISPECIES: WXG100 family type VII secretion target [Bacillus cereus group]KXN99609.1 type VII secretion protein [Bacillus thuringiensis]MCC1486616.1 WXG100 family type VII secretion target [Bacillus tropicus]MDA1549555.1 WXG100 family type VII secretion target [Bacillus cereus group sp. TH243-3LC]MDA1637246.1 WXG100 family type VII secretion target [Bacillus cereus group sp. TH177-1LC]MDA1654512.1 WXG100 family type VII secretion target [Bacillus cereus group sp. TH150LC]